MSKGGSFPDYPTREHGSLGYEVARTAIDAAASVIPGAGYAIGALMQNFLAAPLQRRRDEWFQTVAEGIQGLSEKIDGVDISNLPNNDDFISAVYEATDAAMKTRRAEKIEMLKNGVLNIAAGFTLDDILRGAFFGVVERFSPAHVRILELLANPALSPEMVRASMNVYAGAPIQTLRAAVPESVLDEASLNRVLEDLQREGLAQTGGLNTMTSKDAHLAKRSTPIGDAFLRFISPP